jgi:DNA-cytosine methyltransferase
VFPSFLQLRLKSVSVTTVIIGRQTMDDWDVPEPTTKRRKLCRRSSNESIATGGLATGQASSIQSGGRAPKPIMPTPVFVLPTTTSSSQTRRINIASDCAGLNSVSIGLSMCGLDHKTVFLSERDPRAMSIISTNFDMTGVSVCSDVMSRDDDALKTLGKVDLYTAGPPCQSFSNNGKHGGLRDPRGEVFLRLLKTVKTVLPRCFLFENVPALKNRRHAGSLAAILAELQGLRSPDGSRTYKVRMRLLDTKTHGGLPQRRRRLYIVGFLRKEQKREFKWPYPIPCSHISEIITKSGHSFAKPRQTTRIKKVIASRVAEIRANGGDPLRDPYIVDVMSGHSSPADLVSPCLTRSRCLAGGHWLVSQRRMMTLSEIEALQGFPPGQLTLPTGTSASQYAGLLGNAFTVSVVSRVAMALLRTIGAVDVDAD